jgi:hypothetical protein
VHKVEARIPRVILGHFREFLPERKLFQEILSYGDNYTETETEFVAGFVRWAGNFLLAGKK